MSEMNSRCDVKWLSRLVRQPTWKSQDPSSTAMSIRCHYGFLILLCCLSATGCVRRRMTIRSNPPGAMVYVDDQQIGLTPVSTEFTYYGTRKLRLVKDQFETMTTYHTFAAPWYQIPPLDFVSENLWGREIRDEREVMVNLQPQRVVPSGELLSRANGLRNASQSGFSVPMPAPPAR